MSAGKPLFARIWRGRATKEKADAYERYWLATGSDMLLKKGAVRAEMMREDRETESEFMTISYWPSIEAMAPGGDPYKTHHLAEDADYLIELPERVQILKILDTREAKS